LAEFVTRGLLRTFRPSEPARNFVFKRHSFGDFTADTVHLARKSVTPTHHHSHRCDTDNVPA
jgi:hypothetical protein